MLRLNLGCGPNVFPNWVNVDIEDIEETYLRHLREAPHFDGWPEAQRKLGEYVKAGGEIEIWKADITGDWVPATRRGMDSVPVDAIYLGQVVEHLNPIYELPQLLKRCYKLLKPGGRIRITTPDLERLIDAYTKGKMSDFDGEQPEFYRNSSQAMKLSYIMYGASGPNCTRSNYEGHFACYDFHSMSSLLHTAGFKGLVLGRSSDVFHDVIDCGMSHSMAIEAVK